MKQILNRVLKVVSVQEAIAPEKSGAMAVADEIPERSNEMTWAFIKNLNPREVITFQDGEQFQFPSNFFITSDAELAENIRVAASKYNIIENS